MICKCTGAQQKCYRGFASALERCNISLDDGLLNKKTSAWVILISLFDDMWAHTKNNGFPTCLEHCTSESKTLHSGRQWNVFPILCWSTFRIGTRITSSSFGWCYLCDSYTCKAIARQSIQKKKRAQPPIYFRARQLTERFSPTTQVSPNHLHGLIYVYTYSGVLEHCGSTTKQC